MPLSPIRLDYLSYPAKTVDPFLFFVYHKDFYPKGNSKMEAPKIGNGADFNPNAPYRMYHGNRIPGFPQHPHRGFETVTCTLEGTVDHTDSLGCSGRYGNGDLQWMTAGKGIVHGENFPLIHSDKENTLKLFQLWLNLPAANKMTEPVQIMHWAETIPKVTSADGKAKVTVFAGSYQGSKAVAPPSKSWAADLSNDVGIFHFNLQPGAKIQVPTTVKTTLRNAYFIEGKKLIVNGTEVNEHSRIIVEDSSLSLEFEVPSDAGENTEILLLQGKPIGEPVVSHGPFVMNTRQEIQQAFTDYQRTRFGGWPWAEDAVVFPKEKGRFVKISGVETNPPVSSAKSETDL